MDKGTYFVGICSSDSGVKSTDNYTIQVNYSQSDVWEKEFNEDFKTASDIKINTSYSGSLRGSNWEETDYYKFTLAEAGALTINFSNPLQATKENYWQVHLYNTEYKELLLRQISGAKQSIDLPVVGVPSGVYYIMVESNFGNKSDTTMDVYNINAKFAKSDAWEKEFNDDFTSATKINLDKSYSGCTRDSSWVETDYYQFDIVDSGNYKIEMTVPNLKNDNTFWNLYLYDSVYKELQELDVKGNASNQTMYQYMASGTYYVKITSASGSISEDSNYSSDTYTLKVSSEKNVNKKEEKKEEEKTVHKPDKVYWADCYGKRKAIYLSWDEVDDADGYVIYMSKSQNGNYKKIKKTSNHFFVKKKLRNRKKYFFRIIAYKVVEGKKYYGKYSSKMGVFTR